MQIEDTARRRDRFAIPVTGIPRNGDHHSRLTNNDASCFAREEDLVGVEDNAAKLKWWLVDDLE